MILKFNVMEKRSERIEHMGMTTGRVTRVEAVSPTMKRIVWVSDLERGWNPGDKIKVLVSASEGVMRSYTPSRVDTATGEMELLAHIHGGGPGSDWADGLRAGDVFSFKGPVRSFPVDREAPVSWAMFFGDETTLGLLEALKTSGITDQVIGAVELEPGAMGVLEPVGLGVREVTRQMERGEAIIAYAREVEIPDDEGVFWLSGEADSVVAIRKILLERGVARSRMHIKTYWSTRSKARRKQLDLQMSLT